MSNLDIPRLEDDTPDGSEKCNCTALCSAFHLKTASDEAKAYLKRCHEKILETKTESGVIEAATEDGNFQRQRIKEKLYQGASNLFRGKLGLNAGESGIDDYITVILDKMRTRSPVETTLLQVFDASMQDERLAGIPVHENAIIIDGVLRAGVHFGAWDMTNMPLWVGPVMLNAGALIELSSNEKTVSRDIPAEESATSLEEAIKDVQLDSDFGTVPFDPTNPDPNPSIEALIDRRNARILASTRSLNLGAASISRTANKCHDPETSDPIESNPIPSLEALIERRNDKMIASTRSLKLAAVGTFGSVETPSSANSDPIPSLEVLLERRNDRMLASGRSLKLAAAGTGSAMDQLAFEPGEGSLLHPSLLNKAGDYVFEREEFDVDDDEQEEIFSDDMAQDVDSASEECSEGETESNLGVQRDRSVRPPSEDALKILRDGHLPRLQRMAEVNAPSSALTADISVEERLKLVRGVIDLRRQGDGQPSAQTSDWDHLMKCFGVGGEDTATANKMAEGLVTLTLTPWTFNPQEYIGSLLLPHGVSAPRRDGNARVVYYVRCARVPANILLRVLDDFDRLYPMQAYYNHFIRGRAKEMDDNGLVSIVYAGITTRTARQRAEDSDFSSRVRRMEKLIGREHESCWFTVHEIPCLTLKIAAEHVPFLGRLGIDALFAAFPLAGFIEECLYYMTVPYGLNNAVGGAGIWAGFLFTEEDIHITKEVQTHFGLPRSTPTPPDVAKQKQLEKKISAMYRVLAEYLVERQESYPEKRRSPVVNPDSEHFGEIMKDAVAFGFNPHHDIVEVTVMKDLPLSSFAVPTSFWDYPGSGPRLFALLRKIAAGFTGEREDEDVSWVRGALVDLWGMTLDHEDIRAHLCCLAVYLELTQPGQVTITSLHTNWYAMNGCLLLPNCQETHAFLEDPSLVTFRALLGVDNPRIPVHLSPHNVLPPNIFSELIGRPFVLRYGLDRAAIAIPTWHAGCLKYNAALRERVSRVLLAAEDMRLIVNWHIFRADASNSSSTSGQRTASITRMITMIEEAAKKIGLMGYLDRALAEYQVISSATGSLRHSTHSIIKRPRNVFRWSVLGMGPLFSDERVGQAHTLCLKLQERMKAAPVAVGWDLKIGFNSQTGWLAWFMWLMTLRGEISLKLAWLAFTQVNVDSIRAQFVGPQTSTGLLYVWLPEINE